MHSLGQRISIQRFQPFKVICSLSVRSNPEARTSVRLSPGPEVPTMSSFRFTLRRLLGAIAVVGLSLGLIANLQARRARFLRIAKYHEAIMQEWDKKVGISDQMLCGTVTAQWTDRDWDRFFGAAAPEKRRAMAIADYHAELARKYTNAAASPWYPLSP